VSGLTLPDGRRLQLAPLICYDAVAPELAIAAVREGAELLVTLSNDAWFAAGEGPHLHLVVSAFRSLETRRPQLRATNTGISAVISATGELLTQAGVHERAALVASVPAGPRSGTLMLAWGDWFGRAALVAGLLVLGARRWSR
jgi:apolipoprotein N-acyltransferase